MKTVLLTWNPNRSIFDFKEGIQAIESSGSYRIDWSCGRTKNIDIGDRVFLLRQGKEPRGILASGFIVRAPYEATNWRLDGDSSALYVDVEFDIVLDPEANGVLPTTELREGVLGKVHWSTQRSGIFVPDECAQALEEAWEYFLDLDDVELLIVNHEEIEDSTEYIEGATVSRHVNAYERNVKARQACIDHFGTNCSVCGFSFGGFFGEQVEEYIQVHHIVPLSEIQQEYVVDPLTDLRPVCCNCHAMLHHPSLPDDISSLKEVVQKNRSR